MATGTASGGTTPTGRLLLLRHGQTEWSVSGQHTGWTDVPLTPRGEAQARALPALLHQLLGSARPALVVSSPLQRARRTAELAGLAPVTLDDDLREWDYGAYEGRTTLEIRAELGHDWTAFGDGVAPGGPGQTPGETLEQLAARCARALQRMRPALAGGTVVAVGHGHALRVLAATWLEQPPSAGARLFLDAGSVCVLDAEHGVPGIEHWNLTPALFPGG